MNESYKTIFEECTAEITEKKSRFICSVSHAESENEALEFLKRRRKEHYSAKHSCSAYIIGSDGRLKHCSDDGEPSGTAGRPMLNILESQNLRSVVAVVTRYFGGVLLGTGGLVRAYSGALEKCLLDADIKTMSYGSELKIEAPYDAAGRLQYMFSNENIAVLSSEYGQSVIFRVLVPSEAEAQFIKQITEATAGRSVSEIVSRGYHVL